MTVCVWVCVEGAVTRWWVGEEGVVTRLCVCVWRGGGSWLSIDFLA